MVIYPSVPQKKVGAQKTNIAEAYKNFSQQITFGYETPFLINLQTEKEEKILADRDLASAELVLAGQAKSI